MRFSPNAHFHFVVIERAMWAINGCRFTAGACFIVSVPGLALDEACIIASGERPKARWIVGAVAGTHGVCEMRTKQRGLNTVYI